MLQFVAFFRHFPVAVFQLGNLVRHGLFTVRKQFRNVIYVCLKLIQSAVLFKRHFSRFDVIAAFRLFFELFYAAPDFVEIRLQAVIKLSVEMAVRQKVFPRF